MFVERYRMMGERWTDEGEGAGCTTEAVMLMVDP